MNRLAILFAVGLIAWAVSAHAAAGDTTCLRIPRGDVRVNRTTIVWPEQPLLDGLYDARDEETKDSTRVWLCHDTERLYFLFEVCDTTLHITPADSEKAVGGLDRVELFFSADERMERYYAAEISPYATLDYLGRYYRHCDEAWNFETLDYRSQLTGRGYRIEGSVGLSELRSLGVLLPDGRMRLGIFRGDRAGSGVPFGWYSWVRAGTLRPDFHIPVSQGMAILVDF